VRTEGHPESVEDVRYIEAGEEVGAKTGCHRESGVEASTLSEETLPEGVYRKEEPKDAKGERKARSPVIRSEDVHACGGHPIHKRGFIEEANAVDVRSYIVMTLQHLSSDFDVDGVYVIEQSRGEEATNV